MVESEVDSKTKEKAIWVEQEILKNSTGWNIDQKLENDAEIHRNLAKKPWKVSFNPDSPDKNTMRHVVALGLETGKDI